MTLDRQCHGAGYRPARSRRGGVYVLVLGAATIIAVAGLGVIAASRSDIKTVRLASDWASAGVLAEAGVEAGIAAMNTSSTWRADHAAGGEVNLGNLNGAAGAGAGKVGFRLADPSDGDLKDSSTDPVTVYGYGRKGDAVRCFSLECRYQPAPALDVLRYGVYATGSISVASAVVSGGPLGAASLTVGNGGTLTANVRVGTLVNSGTIVGEVRTGQVSLASLSDGSLGSIDARGVSISYSSIPGGSLRRVLLSAATNPYGAASPTGIYFIRVPALSTLRIGEARIAATLVIELGLTSQLELVDSIHWSPGDPSLPTLVINATALSTVRLGSSTASLSEASANVNFNPATTPYDGVGDTDKTDLYPSEIRGVVHVMSTLASVSLESGVTIAGTLISEGSLTITSATIRHDPQLLQDPPAPYRSGSASMRPVAGTWKWELIE